MDQEKKTAPKNQGAEGRTLADLLKMNDQKIGTVAETLGVDRMNVMEWVCGKVPDSLHTMGLAKVLRCPVDEVYLAIMNTPDLMEDQEH